MSSLPLGSSPDEPAHSLRQRVLGGARAVALCHIAQQLISLAVLAVQSRQLAPADVGLFWMVFPWMMLLRQTATLGLNVATIQRAEISAGQASSLFWCNMGLAAAASLLTIALGPGLAWFFAEPGVAWLALGLAPSTLVAAAAAQHQALLERHLRLAPLAVTRLAAQSGGGVCGIAVAAWGGGPWAFAVQHYVELLLIAVCVWRLERWRPTGPRGGEPVADLLRFGGAFSAGSLVLELAGRLDKLLVGYWLGAAALGIYSQAYNLMMKPVYLLTTPLTGIMLPALSRARDEPERGAEMVRGFLRIVGAASFSTGAGLVLVAPEAIAVLAGPQWTAAAPVLRLLGFAVLAQGFVNVAGSIFTAAGQTRAMFRAALVLLVSLAGGLSLGLAVGQAWDAPLEGVAAGYSATLCVAGAPYLAWCLCAAGVPPRHVFTALVRPGLAAGGMFAVVAAVRAVWLGLATPPAAWLLGVEVVVGAAAFAVFARRDLAWAVEHASGERNAASLAR